MSYQVLARKWRPRSFAEMVGQEHVVRALSNALDHERLHHGYLFTGTRGVGKTTLGRILAKALNCERGVSSTPCGECSACREIDEGRFVDLLEVDAASRTKVDQTRDLLDNVPYAPVRGRFKVYLIDEVHMFSGHSFNALLKTLEEPPPHVKFLLATTDPQKVPVTVLSRCLQFHLKRLPAAQIQGQLQKVLRAEETAFEVPALVRLARAADGSMRDALSLLDQAIAFTGGQVRDADVISMLGAVGEDQVQSLLQRLAEHDGVGLLRQVSEMAERIPDFAGALQQMLLTLHRIAVAQTVPAALEEELEQRDGLLELAARLAPEDVQLFYQIGLIGQRDLPLAPDPRSGFEMILLRMLAFRPAPAAADQSAAGPRERRARAAAKPAPASHTPAPTRSAAQTADRGAAVAAPVASADSGSIPDLSDWHALSERLDLGGIARQLANHCEFHAWDGKTLGLRLDPASEHLRVGSAEKRLLHALEAQLGTPLRVQISVGEIAGETPAQRQVRLRSKRQQAAEAAIQEDPVVQELEDQFAAEVIPDSVRPRSE